MNPSSCTKSIPTAPSLAGLYAITDATQTDTSKLIADVELTLRGGARIIQYRNKSRDKSDDQSKRYETVKQLRKLTREYHALLIINDDVQLARAVIADGVHLGQDDQGLAVARKELGPDAIIGISCYNDFALAQQAAANGADYIAFGRFFPSRTKPDAVAADIALLQRAKRELDLPVAAIGGITADNAQALIDAGADMLAVVNDLFAQTDVRAAAQRYQHFFKK